MKYCTRCLYPANHPLDLTFDANGVCSGCRVHEEKDSLDWNARFEHLKKITASYKNRSGNNYDCVVPVSGARDSYFIVHTVMKKLGLRPLLVTYNKQYNTERGIRNLAYLRTLFGCDLMTMTVSPEKVKNVTRATLRKMGSMYWHCIAGQTVFPVQVAVRFKIPLIIWGAHQGLDQVGMFSHTDEVEMTRKYRKDHDLMGYEAEDLVDETMNVTADDLAPYAYPHDKEIEKVGVRGIYLGNYIRWDSKAQHEEMIRLYEYESASQTRTFDTYNDVDCFHYSDIHDYIKFLKYGYGKVTDHACREIRLKRLTREEGIDLVARYNAVAPKTLPLFLDWLGMTEAGFYYLINQHRDTHAWLGNDDGTWVLKDDCAKHRDDEGVDAVRLAKKEDCRFEVTPSKIKDPPKDAYTLIGRGYVDV
ncbi:MAG: N-acetyl sugar amidotransferase [Candidatus Paceibacterota bacterium]|jgi:N-acetyl sugar amidotransferase